MAFGTWLKKAIGKVGTFITKAAPLAKKVIGAVAPGLTTVAGMIPGVGSALSKGIDALGRSARDGGLIDNIYDKSKKLMGSNGGGLRTLQLD